MLGASRVGGTIRVFSQHETSKYNWSFTALLMRVAAKVSLQQTVPLSKVCRFEVTWPNPTNCNSCLFEPDAAANCRHWRHSLLKRWHYLCDHFVAPPPHNHMSQFSVTVSQMSSLTIDPLELFRDQVCCKCQRSQNVRAKLKCSRPTFLYSQP